MFTQQADQAAAQKQKQQQQGRRGAAGGDKGSAALRRFTDDLAARKVRNKPAHCHYAIGWSEGSGLRAASSDL